MSRDERVLSRAAVRELDRRAIEEYGIDSIVLMENAGRWCADEVESMLAEAGDGPVAVLCGPGNNGGDGLVVARTLVNRGREADVLLAAPLERLERASADVRQNARLWSGLGRVIHAVDTPAERAALGDRLRGAAVIVDALFGTGLDRPLSDALQGVVEAANGAGRPILAVDVPSGLDADSGAVLGAAVRASVTVTFVAAKPGLARGEGPRRAGRVSVAEIGIPCTLLAEAGGSS